jgi:uncharacterized caspase-like protein
MRLEFGADDAKRFSEVFRRHGATVYEVENATRKNFWDAVQSAIREADDQSLLIFYYSGQALVTQGEFSLLPVDTDTNMLAISAISAAHLQESLRRASARVKILFLDTASGRLIDATM